MPTNNFKPIPPLSPEDIGRFWSNVDKTPGHGPSGNCWPWKPSLPKRAYGRFMFGSVRYKAHRIAYFLCYGIDPGDKLSCHRCDFCPCCNPDHIFKGTFKDNAVDRAIKGRSFRPAGEKHWSKRHPEWMDHYSRGQRNHNSRLSPQDVREIRALRESGMTLNAIAIRYSVCLQTIYGIVSGKTWQWLK